MATVTEMLSNTRDRLITIDPNKRAISDSILLQYLNNTQYDLSNTIIFPAQEQSDTIDLVADQQEYDMDALLIKPIVFRYQTNDWIIQPRPLTQIQQYEPDDTGPPTDYYLFNDKVGFYPVPSADETAGVKYWYIRDLKELSTDTDSDTLTTTCEIPSRHHWVVELGAALSAMGTINKNDSYARLQDQYQNQIIKMQGMYMERGADEVNEILRQELHPGDMISGEWWNPYQ